MVFKRPLQHTVPVLQHTVLTNPLPSPRTVLRPIRLRDTRRLARAHPKEHIFHWQWVTSDHPTSSAQQSPHFAFPQDARSACDVRPLSRLCFAVLLSGYNTMRFGLWDTVLVCKGGPARCWRLRGSKGLFCAKQRRLIIKAEVPSVTASASCSTHTHTHTHTRTSFVEHPPAW